MKVGWISGKNYAMGKRFEENVKIILLLLSHLFTRSFCLVLFKAKDWFIYLMLPNINTFSIILAISQK